MIKKIIISIVVLITAIQFIRPDFTNPDIDSNLELHASDEVMAILKTSCYDCHSNESKYPWYADLAPASWILADNINSGRKAINFSQYRDIPSDIKKERLERSIQLIDNLRMPKGSYLMMHEYARLDDAQKEILKDFFTQEIEELGLSEW